VEVPPIKPSVVEHQQFAVTCGDCGATTVASLPAGVPRGAFGPRLMAMLAVITAKYRLSKRAAREMLSDFLAVDLCLGSVAKVEKQVSAALAAPYEEARAPEFATFFQLILASEGDRTAARIPGQRQVHG
jgi:hypothetical protein